MINASVGNKQSDPRTRVFRAAILSAPFWAAGMLFIAVLFSLAHDASFGSLQFVALSLIVVLASMMAALRVMDRDMLRVNVRRAIEHRRMRIHSRRVRSMPARG